MIKISTKEKPRVLMIGVEYGGGARPPPSQLAARSGLRRGRRVADGEVGLDLREVLLADAADVHQLLGGLERSLLPVLDDPRGELGADPGQRGELLGGGGVEVDLAGRGRLGRQRDAAGQDEGDDQGQAGGEETLRAHGSCSFGNGVGCGAAALTAPAAATVKACSSSSRF